MQLISLLFDMFLYRPLMNALILLYQIIPGNDFGIAIILLTVLIRLVLYPLSAKGIQSQRAITEIQPKIKETQEKYKNDKERQVKEVLNVYKEAKINPFSGFLPLFIQLPVLIALYKVLWGVQELEAGILYGFISHPGYINFLFLGIIDLAKSGMIEVDGGSSFLLGNMLIIIGAGVAQFFQMKMITVQKRETKGKKDATQEMADKIQKQMLYFFPFFTIFILLRLPSAIALYWLIGTVFSIIQQHFILKKI
ncbi:MAG: YidC/Oxa1 family membrane protein insertase [Candidatus Nealsonbacteria bacterium]|nr:YidC/Oxa1 family membrane protein insertase [Candidatus Nealsonbacteria bacterium]